MSRSNLFLASLLIIFIIRWYFFGGYFLFEENISLLSPMQNYLVSICNQIMPEPQSSLLAGILIGEKQSLEPDFKKALINTSTIHIVVVSGQNLSMLAGFLIAFSPWFGRKKTVLTTIAILIGYSILTGLQLPVIRAALMSIFSLVASASSIRSIAAGSPCMKKRFLRCEILALVFGKMEFLRLKI